MEQLQPGMKVIAIDNRPVGRVGRLRDCCFEVLHESGASQHLIPYVLLSVISDRVALVCRVDRTLHYACANEHA